MEKAGFGFPTALSPWGSALVGSSAWVEGKEDGDRNNEWKSN
jgi:hypothetical protein